MALAIDTKPLAQNYIPQLQRDLDDYAGGRTRRFQIYQVFAHATIIHDASTIRRLFKERRLKWATQEALHWQADPDDDQEVMEVFNHLHLQAKTSPLLAEAISQSKCANATTTLVTSCTVQSPPVLNASALGRPLSSFHRYCIRWSILSIWGNDLSMCESAIPQGVFPTTPKRPRGWWPYLELRIDGTSCSLGEKPAVVWQLQYDFVDLLSRRSHHIWRPGKRRRTKLNRFHPVSSARVQDSSAAYHFPEAKKFNGVRYRPDRGTWTAEMKPAKCKDKVHFGQFKFEVEAARAIDAAFHFYGKPELLNFPDTTPQILSTMPLPAGLDEKDMKRFVKEQAKRLAFMASALPSTPTSTPSKIPESSARGCSVEPLMFPSISEIASFLNYGDADSNISQFQPWLHSDPMAGLVSNGLMEPNSVAADAGGTDIGTLEEGQVVFQFNSLNGLTDPFLCPQRSVGSSVCMSDGWDGAPAKVANFVNPPLPFCESQRTWMENLLMSPPVPAIPMPSSPSYFQDDVAHGWLEQQSFGGERPLGMI